MSTNGKYFDDTGIPFPAPAGGVLSGGYFMHGGICCVARTDEATAGADVACDTRGVFELPKAGVAVTAGDELYDSAGSVTNVQSGTLQPIGCAFADALIGATTVDVVLNKGIEADSDVGTLTANLASTANAKGASLVGIEDAGLYYATGTVEAALQEIGAAGFGTQLTAAAVVAAGNLVEGVGGARATVDSGIAAATLPTMAAVGGAGNLVQTAAADRAQSDSGIAVANVPQMAAVGGAGNFVQTAAADRAQSDSGVAVADVAAFLADPNIEAVDLEVAQADASDGLNFVPFMIEVDCTAVAVDGIAVAPVKLTVIDCWSVSLGANGGGTTVTVRDTAGGIGTAVSSALPIAADTDLSRTTVLVGAVSEFAQGASIYCNKTNAADDCAVYLVCMPIT